MPTDVGEPKRSQTRRRRVIFACLSGLVLVGLGVMTPRMYPVRRGTSAQFWRVATGVDPDGITRPGLGDVYSPGDGWCYYESQGFHGSLLFRVPEEEVTNDLPRMVEVCQKIAADHTLNPELREVLERSVARLQALAASGRIAPASRDPLSALIRETEEVARGNEFRPEAHEALIRLKNDLYGIGLDHHQQDPALYEEMRKMSEDLADVAWHNYLLPMVRAGLARFLRLGREELARQSVRTLVEDLAQARLDYWKKESPDVYSHCLFARHVFEERRQRLQWFWATFAFEWLFFSGLAAYLVWPLFRGWDWRRWLLHLSFLPVLLMLPAYFRYATLSFTSAGPTGGVLYPWLARCFAGAPGTVSIEGW